jgi:hypothetical protein
MGYKVLVVSAVLAAVLILTSSLPALAQGPPFSDIESEIDVVQWGIIYHPKDGYQQYLEAIKLLIVMEIADKLVERAMVEYTEEGQVTDRIQNYLNRAVKLLERTREITTDGGFPIGTVIDRAVETEICKENKLGEYGWLSAGDEPWTGASFEAFGGCTEVDCYINVLISRINLWTTV